MKIKRPLDVEELRAGTYICSQCGAKMVWHDPYDIDMNPILECEECGHMVHIDDYGDPERDNGRVLVKLDGNFTCEYEHDPFDDTVCEDDEYDEEEDEHLKECREWLRKEAQRRFKQQAKKK